MAERHADDVGLPFVRRVVAVTVLLVGGAVLVGWVQPSPNVFGLALLLVGLGLLV